MRLVKYAESMPVNIKKLMYMCNAKTVFDTEALFHDGTKDYRYPQECECGDEVCLRLRTKRFDADAVYLCVDGVEQPMEYAEHDSMFDYYVTKITAKEQTMYYYFRIEAAGGSCYYNQAGAATKLNAEYNYRIMPGFRVPGWAKGAVMYQIYVDRFCDGDKTNNVLDREYVYINDYVTAVSDWDKIPEAMGVREFYGGDLKGVMEKLDYLSELGVEVIYFNPLFVSPSNHKYDIQDYDYIDPHIGCIVSDKGEVLPEGDYDNSHAGRYIDRVANKANLEASNELFCRLCKEIHNRGMKVIIDGVFNHCGSFNKWMDREHIYSGSGHGYEKGAYESGNSPYNKFFKFKGGQWPNNGEYDGWWGHDTLPKLNYEESKELEDYIIGVGVKWVSPPYSVDGWRLDVAADLGYSAEYNHKFWKRFRKEVKAANPDAVILAEHYGDSGEWLKGDEWDAIMNYDAFMEPVTWFLTGMEKHSDESIPDMRGDSQKFFAAMNHHMARMGTQSVEIAMNELSNHDHSRFLTRTNRRVGRIATAGAQAASEGIDKSVFKEAVVMQMTLPGAPTIYYGDEAGVCGWTDPDNRRTYPWGHEDKELIEFHRAAIKLHKEHSVLRCGSYMPLVAQKDVLAYGRFDSKDAIVVVVNNSDDERRVIVPVWKIGVFHDDDMEQILVSYINGYSVGRIGYTIKDGKLDIVVRPDSAVVLKKI